MSVVFDKEKIKQLYPGAEEMMIEPMKIHGSTDEKIREICSGKEYFAQVKKDGAWYMYCHCEDEEGNEHSYLFSRTISVVTGLLSEKSANVPHIMRVLDDHTPVGTCIVGEIYYPGKESKDAIKVMGSLPERAQKVQEELGPIHFYMHDMLWHDGENLIEEKVTNYGRYMALVGLIVPNGLTEEDSPYQFIELADIFQPDTTDFEWLLNEVLSKGEEGLVFKAYKGIYEPGKRPMTNWKAKKKDGIDAVIVGFDPPTKEYTGKELNDWLFFDENDSSKPVTKAWFMGWTNSVIKIGLAYGNSGYFREIGTVSSGISDDMKEDMTINPEKYLFKTCEIGCMEKDNKAGTLRHPYFVRMREDKDPKDCKYSEVFGDSK